MNYQFSIVYLFASFYFSVYHRHPASWSSPIPKVGMTTTTLKSPFTYNCRFSNFFFNQFLFFMFDHFIFCRQPKSKSSGNNNNNRKPDYLQLQVLRFFIQNQIEFSFMCVIILFFRSKSSGNNNNGNYSSSSNNYKKAIQSNCRCGWCW